MKIGIDVDGVLADFNRSFIKRCIAVTGRDLFPPRPFDITTWNYPESYGYTADEVSTVWTQIKQDRAFWYSLGDYDTTMLDIAHLGERIVVHHDDVYFVTARPGVDAKRQTEMWLERRFSPEWFAVNPTVLITSHKGLAVQTLGLDCYIDDRWENCLDAAGVHWAGKPPICKVFVMDRPWNRQDTLARGHMLADGTVIDRVSSVSAMLHRL